MNLGNIDTAAYWKDKVVYEDLDSNVIVLRKPPGIQTDRNDKGLSLEAMAQKHIHPDLKCAHRLDKNTTGPVILGINGYHGTIRNALGDKNRGLVEKRYAALSPVHQNGSTYPEVGIHNANLDVGKSNVKVLDNLDKNGKPSSLRIDSVDVQDGIALSDIRLLTGRKHQIRAMLSHMGFPLVGDKQYARGRIVECKEMNLQRYLLHCFYLKFPYEDRNGEQRFAEAIVPPEDDLWNALGDNFPDLQTALGQMLAGVISK